MLYAELCNESINGANLYAFTSTRIAEHRCLDVCLAAWIEERENLQSLDDACLIFGTIEPLQEFLDYDACSNDGVAIQ